jgi:copper(I)-binding protein
MASHLHLPAALMLTVGLLGATACGDSSVNQPAASASASTAPAGTVTVSKPWSRTSAVGAVNGAVYFTISSPGDDRITGVEVPSSVAGRAELHETVTADMTSTTAMGGSMASDTTAMGGSMGGMTMQKVDGIDLKAGVPFALAPGGFHVMMFDLVAPLKAGDMLPLTIHLQKAGTISVTVPVQDSAP